MMICVTKVLYWVQALHSICKGTDLESQRKSMVTNEKQKLLTWQTTRKKTKVTVERDNKVVELPKIELCPFARMMMVCKSCPEINIAQAVRVYELSLEPRSLFTSDGSMLHCSTKSALMNAIEKHVNPEKSTTEWS